jgi:hypothetical protein
MNLLTLTFSVRADPWITPYGMGADYEENHEWDYSISTEVRIDGKQWLSDTWTKNPVSVSLEGLSNGGHTLEVTATAYAHFQGKLEGYSSQQGSSGVIHFQADIPPPSIRVLTSQETFEAYSSTADVPLNFTVNEPVSWIGYCIDGKNAVTATDQVVSAEWLGVDKYQLVLIGIPAGTHNLIVYAEDAGGNRGASEPFSFTVTQQTQSETEQTQPETEQTESFPTALAAVGLSTAVIAVSSGLMVYFKKRK